MGASIGSGELASRMSHRIRIFVLRFVRRGARAAAKLKDGRAAAKLQDGLQVSPVLTEHLTSLLVAIHAPGVCEPHAQHDLRREQAVIRSIVNLVCDLVRLFLVSWRGNKDNGCSACTSKRGEA